jgi:hypothetical protein
MLWKYKQHIFILQVEWNLLPKTLLCNILCGHNVCVCMCIDIMLKNSELMSRSAYIGVYLVHAISWRWQTRETYFLTIPCILISLQPPPLLHSSPRVSSNMQILSFLLAYFPYFEKLEVGLCYHAVCVSVYPLPIISFWMSEPIFTKLGM